MVKKNDPSSVNHWPYLAIVAIVAVVAVVVLVMNFRSDGSADSVLLEDEEGNIIGEAFKTGRIMRATPRLAEGVKELVAPKEGESKDDYIERCMDCQGSCSVDKYEECLKKWNEYQQKK